MNKESAINTIWDYMHMCHPLKKAGCIFILGSIDPRVATHAASLYHKGYAPAIAISGDGTKHETALLGNQYEGQTEATILKQVCLEAGVPESAILIEDKANNTGQNFEFITPVLENAGVALDTIIAVQKPYMERRTYATGKIWWPDTELIISSPPGTFDEYVTSAFDPDIVININHARGLTENQGISSFGLPNTPGYTYTSIRSIYVPDRTWIHQTSLEDLGAREDHIRMNCLWL